MLWRGQNATALNDDLNTTCVSLDFLDLYFQSEYVILTQDYNTSVDVWLSGRGLVCPAVCPDRHPIQVFQQGRSPGSCVHGAPLCLGASMCDWVSGTTYSGGNWVTCQFRCDCPLAQFVGQSRCNKALVMFGDGSVASEGGELCDISITGD